MPKQSLARQNPLMTTASAILEYFKPQHAGLRNSLSPANLSPYPAP